ncbi:PEGA domain-containing protein [Chitinophaga lutea]|uniref:PEGA domain-containing protein n=1 Tax=Chitinophaga lutea TaxID=2488634 RepID=A0A3N4PKY1_9BACT|nr:PEGA domain-containing protein [Chitinophaga lutea]RPE05501.1 PEGA domain-containing protein [Chitinophaga lutea]
MKKYFVIVVLAGICWSCKKNNPSGEPPPASGYVKVTVAATETGFIYLDGSYTGIRSPNTIEVPKGNHVIGVALQSSFQYLKKEVNLTANATVNLTAADKPAPKVWKALWIGLHETTGSAATGDCSTRFSKADLDAGFDFYKWSISQHFEKYSYGTMQWETERRDISVPVRLKKGSNTWFTVEPDSITKLLPDIRPGAYDCIFVFWRESEGNCSFTSNYFGLAWTNPMNETIKTGFVTIKFNAGTNINDRINYYKTTDPGVWLHEWLHTTGEYFYQAKGKKMPQKAGDGLVVHAAELYGYNFPWMNWYLDFISGRVPGLQTGSGYLGIGPETFLKCTVRETAVNNCP